MNKEYVGNVALQQAAREMKMSYRPWENRSRAAQQEALSRVQEMMN